MMYDVLIIGGGFSGSAIARELSKYNGKIAVLEKTEDLCEGTSKANTALVHGGFDAKPGTLKAKLNVQGNEMMGQLAKDLDIPFERNGALVLCFDEEDIPKLEELKKRGEENGVKGLSIINQEELRKLEPNVTDDAVAALYCTTAGIICTFTLNFALAENAYENGAEFYFNTEVTGFTRKDDRWIVHTNNGDYESKVVINAAGVYADELHNMVSENKHSITPRRGEYFLMDKQIGDVVTRTVFQLPGKLGKGIVVTPTVDGNLLMGPTAEDIGNKEGIDTTKEGLDYIMEKSTGTLKSFPYGSVITSFAGLRAHDSEDDFVVEEVADAEYFFDALGIESPGLSSSPAIGLMMADLVSEKLKLEKKDNFKETRKGLPLTNRMTREEHKALIEKDKSFSKIICRCEMITEGEIVAAIHSPLGSKTLDGLKRRVRAGAGRCQGGFCAPKVIEIISRELNIPQEEVMKNNSDAKIILGRTKE